MNKIICLYIFCISFVAAGAQDQLILATGDTLNGKIEILLPSSAYEEIMFENDDVKKRYKAFEFVSFIDDGTQYRTVKFGDKYRIMEVESDGYLSLLRFRSDEAFAFNAQFLYKIGGEGVEVPNFMFKKAMMNYMEDCGPVKEALAEGNYRKKDLEELVATYNACMAAKTEDRMEEFREKEILAKSSPLIDELTNVKLQSEQMKDDELTNMLEDVILKLKSGESVPNYLKNALTEHVSDGHQLKQPIEVLVKQL